MSNTEKRFNSSTAYGKSVSQNKRNTIWISVRQSGHLRCCCSSWSTQLWHKRWWPHAIQSETHFWNLRFPYFSDSCVFHSRVFSRPPPVTEQSFDCCTAWQCCCRGIRGRIQLTIDTSEWMRLWHYNRQFQTRHCQCLTRLLVSIRLLLKPRVISLTVNYLLLVQLLSNAVELETRLL